MSRHTEKFKCLTTSQNDAVEAVIRRNTILKYSIFFMILDLIWVNETILFQFTNTSVRIYEFMVTEALRGMYPLEIVDSLKNYWSIIIKLLKK